MITKECGPRPATDRGTGLRFSYHHKSIVHVARFPDGGQACSRWNRPTTRKATVCP
jgi:hypothetical protein